MFCSIFNKPLNRLEDILSQFLDDFRAALANVPVGGGTDQATKDAVAALVTKTTDLATQLANNDAGDATNAALIADHSTAISELVAKLTPPAVPVP